MDAFLGIDVGTTAAKAALFDAHGEILRAARVRLPALHVNGAIATQPLHALVEQTEDLVCDIVGTAPIRLLALTTQRDTAIVLDAVGSPLGDLVSWRDVRHTQHGTLWDALAIEGSLPTHIRVRSLPSYLSERWTGEAVEARGNRPRHQSAAALETLRALDVSFDAPKEVDVGARVGTIRASSRLPSGVALHVTTGDKNAEMLGAGVNSAGIAGLSLGSAISLGIVVNERPEAAAGCVLTAAAEAGRWNVETGLLVGVDGLDILRAWYGRPDLEPDPCWRDGLWCVPLFGGAIDRPDARAMLSGLTASTAPGDVARAWAQGVACELARLLPSLERAGGVLSEIRTYGGGAGTLEPSLLADVLDRPVRALDDVWCGARGAVMSALLACGDAERAHTLLASVQDRLAPAYLPDPARRHAVARYRAVYERLIDEGVTG